VSPLEIAGVTIFILALYAGIFSIVFGMPGTVIILIDAILYATITEFDKIGIEILVILLLISVPAESLDFMLRMKSKIRFGTYGKGAWAPLIGSIIGAVIMTQALLGLGTFTGIFFGGFIGVVVMELIHVRQLKPALRDGYGVIIGRFIGMFVKGVCALVMIIIALTNIYS